jgi:hypothetical protein
VQDGVVDLGAHHPADATREHQRARAVFVADPEAGETALELEVGRQEGEDEQDAEGADRDRANAEKLLNHRDSS